MSKSGLRYVDVAVILHLRENGRPYAREVLRGLVTRKTSGSVAVAEVIDNHRLAADGLLARRRLREHVALVHTRGLRLET